MDVQILLTIYQPSGNPNNMQKIGTPIPIPTHIISISMYKITTILHQVLITFLSYRYLYSFCVTRGGSLSYHPIRRITEAVISIVIKIILPPSHKNS